MQYLPLDRTILIGYKKMTVLSSNEDIHAPSSLDSFVVSVLIIEKITCLPTMRNIYFTFKKTLLNPIESKLFNEVRAKQRYVLMVHSGN
jgi:hypothetical protein